jgi:hypothetical protein
MASYEDGMRDKNKTESARAHADLSSRFEVGHSRAQSLGGQRIINFFELVEGEKTDE